MTTCKSCGSDGVENFCPGCGHAASIKRIDHHYIQHEIQHVLHFEKGILFTIKALLIRPGKSVRAFIADERNRLVKPIIFIIISSLIYTLITHFFHLDDGYIKFVNAKRNATTAIFEWVQNHYGYANIIMGVFIALWLKLFFRKNGYNFFEILILLCFVMGFGMLIFALFATIQGITKADLTQVSGMIFMAYCTWAIGQFFDHKKIGGYVKALAAYLLGMISFVLAAMLIGYVFDALLSH